MRGGASYGDGGPIAAAAGPGAGMGGGAAGGAAALAIVRTSGAGSVELLAPFFSPGEKLRAAPGNRVVHGWILDAGGRRIDEVLVSVYRAPRSYTGEEGADISCHGGPAVLRGILRVLREAGFREALPGEFTFRAFMNGKLDLTRAESVMELVSARSDRGRAGAVDRLAGALEEEIRGLADRLKVCLAGMELYLDYSEDDGIAPEEEEGGFPGRKAVETIRARVRHLADSYRLERIYRDGALGVIAGRPNAGKSSLFNLLLKEDRSLVSEIPGTTRDWIESGLSLEGIPLRLADTAGLRGSAGPEDPAGLLDPVEELGIRRSRELLAAADLVIYLIDGTRGLEPEDREFFNGFPQVGEAEAPAGWNPRKPERGGAAEGSVPAGGDLAAPGGGRAPPLIVLWNKGDLCPLPGELPAELPGGAIEVSAKTGAGTEALIEAIRGALEGLSGGGQGGASSAGAGTARQKELLDRAAASLGEALSLGDRGGALDLIAPALREALNALGEITGEVSTADILETMFSRFCVGK